MRADAQRNRRLLLDAACALFIEFGLQVSLAAVSRRAGVSIATLYRHFPDRKALVTAVAADVMARTRVEARTALARISRRWGDAVIASGRPRSPCR